VYIFTLDGSYRPLHGKACVRQITNSSIKKGFIEARIVRCDIVSKFICDCQQNADQEFNKICF